MAERKDKTLAKQYWDKKYALATEFMKERGERYSAILVEVAAQHPLDDGLTPNEEFRGRLDHALSIYNKMKPKGIDVYFYVPGSRHRIGEIEDKVSLSEAGKNYLLEKGIPDEYIFGEEESYKYKGDDGVYNSGDECFVTAQIFINGEYGRLCCVCSPYQVMRKLLFYVEQGVVAECFAVPSSNMFHNPIEELFYAVDNVLYEDHDWQDPNSDVFINCRLERRPKNGK